MLNFYNVLGFEVTYQQARPNTYAVVRRGNIELHFFALSGLDPAQSYSTCLVLAPDAGALSTAFTAALRQHYGKLPSTGIPRITPLRNKADGTRGFNVVDPGGNWIRIVQKVEVETPESENEHTPEIAESTRLSQATNAANLLAESKGDYVLAAKTLDIALARNEDAPAVQRVQALVSRAGMAIALGDKEQAKKILAQALQIPLENEDRATLADELQRVDDLEQSLL